MRCTFTRCNNTKHKSHIEATVLSANAAGGRDDAPCIEEASVLSKSRCPYTGVVNFFTDADPLLSVGSVAQADAPGRTGRYVWRCYLGDETGGLADDMLLAEAQLRRALACDAPNRDSSQRRKSEPALPSRSAAYWQKLNETTCWQG